MSVAEICRRAIAVLCTLGALVGLGPPLEADQSRSATPSRTSLRLMVLDEQHYPVPGATCTLHNPRAPSAPDVTAVTDQNGVATLSGEAGAYVLHVVLDGFTPIEKDGL